MSGAGFLNHPTVSTVPTFDQRFCLSLTGGLRVRVKMSSFCWGGLLMSSASYDG